jgi:hypothetical protein
MKKIYVGDDSHLNNGKETGVDPKITAELLKEKIKEMAIYAEVDVKSRSRAIVIVHPNAGTTMYMSSEFNDHFWLQTNCVKKELLGDTIKYHFVLD